MYIQKTLSDSGTVYLRFKYGKVRIDPRNPSDWGTAILGLRYEAWVRRPFNPEDLWCPALGLRYDPPGGRSRIEVRCATPASPEVRFSPENEVLGMRQLNASCAA